MSQITEIILKAIMPTMKPKLIAEVLPVINKTAFDYEINNQKRLAAWLATLAQESGEFKYQEELASGDAYDTRTDLGNTPQKDGDGRQTKGRGRIQITGTTNYIAYTKYVAVKKHLPAVDFMKEPKVLATEPYATDAAGWYFAVYKNLNPVADRGDFLTTQIRVNGRNKDGFPNHWKERSDYYKRALKAIPVDFVLTAPIVDLGILATVNVD